MKAVLIEPIPIDKKPASFPGLFRNVDDGGAQTIILFQTKEYGVIVRCNNIICLGNSRKWDASWEMLPAGNQVVLENL